MDRSRTQNEEGQPEKFWLFFPFTGGNKPEIPYEYTMMSFKDRQE